MKTVGLVFDKKGKPIYGKNNTKDVKSTKTKPNKPENNTEKPVDGEEGTNESANTKPEQ